MEALRAWQIGFLLAMRELEAHIKDKSLYEPGLHKRVKQVAKEIGVPPEELADWLKKAHQKLLYKIEKEKRHKK